MFHKVIDSIGSTVAALMSISLGTLSQCKKWQNSWYLILPRQNIFFSGEDASNFWSFRKKCQAFGGHSVADLKMTVLLL